MAQGPFGTQDQLAIASLGTEFALIEIIGAAAGYWLDKQWGTLPWCLIGGVVLGFAGGLARVVQVARQAGHNLDNKKKPNERS